MISLAIAINNIIHDCHVKHKNGKEWRYTIATSLPLVKLLTVDMDGGNERLVYRTHYCHENRSKDRTVRGKHQSNDTHGMIG